MSQIQEALERQNKSDKVYIGEVAEKFYYSEAGELFRALLNGLRSKHSSKDRPDRSTPAERVLGRLEAIQEIQDAFEQMMADKENLVEPAGEEVPQKEEFKLEDLNKSPLEVDDA